VNAEQRIADSTPSNLVLQRAAAVAETLAIHAAHYDASMTFPIESFQAIRGAGLLKAALSSEHGGADLDGRSSTSLALLRMLKHIGRGDLSVGRLFEGHVNALQLIQTFGRPDQIARWASDVRDGELLFAVWNTEAGDGVRFVPGASGRYRMHGSKTFASGAGHVERPIVTGALPDGGWQMCVVPLDRAGAAIDRSWWQPSGMRASTSFKVDFTGIELEQSDLLGDPGDYHLQPWFSGGAIRFAAVHLGGAEALLDATRAFLRMLNRAGDPHQQSRLGQAAIHVESGNLWLAGAARVVDIGQSPPSAASTQLMVDYANMTRLAIERVCMDVMQLCERAVGARGLLQPYVFERIIRDLTLYLRQPAPDAAQTSAGQYILDREKEAYRIWYDEID
jgi:alkylation response protein AidB-like acyl-CoA dehydrogenase